MSLCVVCSRLVFGEVASPNTRPRSVLRQNAVVEGRGSSTIFQIPEPVYRGKGQNFSKSQSLREGFGVEFFQASEPKRKLGRGIFSSPKAHITGELRISPSTIPYAGATSYFPHISSYSFLFTISRNSRHQAGAVLANPEITPLVQAWEFWPM